VTNRTSVAVAFVLAHLWALLMGIAGAPYIFGDVQLYHWWAQRGFSMGLWPILDEPWVYPAGALIPVTLPGLGTGGWGQYAALWCAMIVALNASATIMLVRRGRRGRVAALWWLIFLAALGPVWIGRLDGVAAPLILIALLVAAQRPAVATAVATFGAWVKIAPAAIVVALGAVAVGARRWRMLASAVLAPGALVSVAIIGSALIGGAGSRAWSVFGEQSSRTLQVESVTATWFSVARAWDPSITVAYNDTIFTWEVQGTGAQSAAQALDIALPIAVALIAVLTWLAVRRCQGAAPDVLCLATTATLAALIAFNKVGSPQFVAWLGPAVAAALALAGRRKRRVWRPSAAGLLGVGLLTQVIYPAGYGPFINGEAWMVVVVALRNVGVVMLLGWAVWRLVRVVVWPWMHDDAPSSTTLNVAG
jgi:hypothetical protein